jgi:beta-N-acetylhexosaminidase
MRLKKTFLLLISGLIFGLNLKAQTSAYEKPEFLQYTNSKWVDSVMTELSPDERIAQLLMIPAFSNKDAAHKKEVLKHIKEYKIGGLIFMQGNPKAQLELMNDYQLVSKVPLLGAIDGEWGLGMRLDNTISYPYQMALGAIQGEELIYDMGVEIARQIKRTGLHVNFGPVVDVNNNPQNPVINYRSFGEDKFNVSKKGIAYMKGMQSQNLLATAKHFPGHGDTDTDSHYALPQINHPFERLNELELYPFKELIKAGVGGVMVAHLDIPALDSTGAPSTLSKPIITGILKERLGFEGLIVTDAMNMKGVAIGNEPGEVDKKAILAGNDLLEFSEDIPKAIAEIRNAIHSGLISQAEIDSRCRKLLAVKQWVGLNNYNPIAVKDVEKEINSGEAEWLNRRLVEASLTLLKNKDALLPLQKLDTLKIASISVGASKTTDFQKSLSLYAKVENFQLDREANASKINDLKNKLKDYNLVIVGLHDFSIRPRNEIRLSEGVRSLISELSQMEKTIFSLFKNPYVINDLKNIEKADVLIEAYQDSQLTQQLSAQLIFGGIGASGKLPVSIGEKFKAGDGLDLKGGIRFKYSAPEDAGMNSEVLRIGIDSLMNQAMTAKAIPGGVVLVAKDQKVVFHKAYGLHKYSDTIKVKESDIYDLASISKISTALPAIMKLYDEAKFDLEAGIDDYLPYFKNSNKEEIAFRKILAHQAGFKPWIPYWKNTLRDNGSFKWNTFKKDSSARYPVKVSEDLWLHRNYKHKIFKAIKNSPLEEKREYKYSGLVFYLLPEIVERITNEDFETYIDQNFYKKLGATTVTYNPARKFELKRIVPTESDFNFRSEQIHGNVHDEGAIMMGGVSANAGLFAKYGGVWRSSIYTGSYFRRVYKDTISRK